jgi:hypothetical protein
MQDTDSIIHIHSDFALSYEEALNRFNAELEDIPEESHSNIDGFRYEGDHGEECYVSSKDAFKTFLMHPVSGAVQTDDEWGVEKEEIKKSAAADFSAAEIDEQFKTLIEVVRINGEWVEA